ncbi:PhoX family protein [Nesterenkonia halophila]|uniref:PhoX family protein n=1 Tax=Nesterenkonia halophila TaxID=302044 RepID=UPI001291DB65|nr:PhoX family phosphatase [Nesterenkonia halophila]
MLPMLDHVRGKRSAVTCALKCDNICARAACNTSDNDYFRDVASSALSRRQMLGAGAAGALALAVGAASDVAGTQPAAAKSWGASKLTFTPIDPVHHAVDGLIVPEGYTWEPVIRWGDGLFPDSPAFDPENQSADSQAKQFGYNNDYLEIQEVPGSNGRRGLLFANHEYTNENLMFPDSTDEATRRAVGMAAHGMTAVEVVRKNRNDAWSVDVAGSRNRRFTMHTEYTFDGPLRGSELLATSDDPEGVSVRGTINNCAGGLTPWGTMLSGEENFHGYFVSAGTSEADRRYGITAEATARGWEIDEPRFDARNAGHEHEKNKFGWIVEVDPWDPESTPVKHTGLGRFNHEGATVIIADSGHAVAYSGDDARFEYLYKFVSRDTYVEGDREHNKTLLSEGDLYVARFTGNSPAGEIDGSGAVPSDGAFDGGGTWLPLLVDGASQVSGFSVEEVLVHTRLAADAVGATKMDRPEDVEPNPVTGRVYMACTNNDERATAGNAGVDEPNPRAKNRDGHVVEITEQGDQTATSFGWTLVLVCGDPAQGDATYFSGFPADQVSPISCPDNVAFDSVGNLWISTDGAPSGIGYCDGLFRVQLEGEDRGLVEQFLSVPAGAETCGPVIRDTQRTAFVAVQHPGEDGSWQAPQSFFPDYVDSAGDGRFAMPRPSVVQILKGKPKRGTADRRQRQLIGEAHSGGALRQGPALG